MKIRNALLLCLTAAMMLSSCKKADSSSESESENFGEIPVSVSLFGKEVSLPCQLSELPDNIVFDRDSALSLNYADAFVDIYDDEIDRTKSNKIGRVVVEDCLEDGKAISEISRWADKRISFISIENIAGTGYTGESIGRYDIEYGGIGYDTSQEEFKEKFGDPDVDISELLIYYLDDEGRNFVQIGFQGGMIDDIDISLYDWSSSWIHDENKE